MIMQFGNRSHVGGTESESYLCVGGTMDGRRVQVRWPSGYVLAMTTDRCTVRLPGPMGYAPSLLMSYVACRAVDRMSFRVWSERRGDVTLRAWREARVLVFEEEYGSADVDQAVKRELNGLPFTIIEPNILETERGYAEWMIWVQLKLGIDYYDLAVEEMRHMILREERGLSPGDVP